MKRVHVWISGRVQGVFFRARTKGAAQSLRLRGWVRNLSDGRVEALFEGEDADVSAMIEWCRKGPPLSEVRSIDIREEAAGNGLNGFEIRYGDP
ncbi:MAG TPA: acylphosphatase [Syntrophales bacterium]|nr:acylphosphatase [Syntrophales bacterium]